MLRPGVRLTFNKEGTILKGCVVVDEYGNEIALPVQQVSVDWNPAEPTHYSLRVFANRVDIEKEAK